MEKNKELTICIFIEDSFGKKVGKSYRRPLLINQDNSIIGSREVTHRFITIYDCIFSRIFQYKINLTT